MELFLQNINPKLSSVLRSPYLEHKKAKKLILNARWEKNPRFHTEILSQNHQIKTAFWTFFYSASYSGDWLCLGITQPKIWVDIEIVKPRSPHLLTKYASELKILWWTSNWNDFYRLRTAKEALLKANNLKNLDLINDFKLVSVKASNRSFPLAEKKQLLHCDLELIIAREQKSFVVQSFVYEEIIGAICILDNEKKP